MSVSTSLPTLVNSSLYVGDLDVYVDETMLYEKFSQCGPVELVRICCDKVTKQSLGYAYINYYQPEDAERALDTMNFELLNGKPMRIMWCQRDPALRKSGIGNVFIKNLDPSIDNKALYDTFSSFGHIISCKIMLDENAKSKGYGFVHFLNEESAELAINAANDKLIEGKRVFVGKFISKHLRGAESSENLRKYKNVFVKNFDQDLNDDSLSELFARFGEIKSAKVEMKPTGESAGFGFVEFTQSDSALKAVHEMNDYVLNNKKLVVTKFEKKSERLAYLKKLYEERKQELIKKSARSNLFVKNLDEKIDDKRLLSEFSKYGRITSAKIMFDENMNSKGFGFVCFSSADEAARAIDDMNGRMIGTKPIHVCIAQRKEDRKKILAAKLKERYQANQYPAIQYTNQYQNYASSVPRWQQNKFIVTQHQQYQQHQQQQANFVQYQQQHFINQSRIAQQKFNQPLRPFNNPNFYNQQHQQFQQTPPNRYAINQSVQQSQHNYNDQQAFLSQLSSLHPQLQKNLIGERLYVKIANLSSENPGKITGMFLEGIDTSELILMLENEQVLINKIREAEQLLKIHHEKFLQGQSIQQNQIKSV